MAEAEGSKSQIQQCLSGRQHWHSSITELCATFKYKDFYEMRIRRVGGYGCAKLFIQQGTAMAPVLLKSRSLNYSFIPYLKACCSQHLLYLQGYSMTAN